MAFPYQCLEVFGDILVAASLSRLDLFSLKDGSQLSSWTCSDLQEKSNTATEDCELSTGCIQECELPTKRRKFLHHDVNREDTGNELDKVKTTTPDTPASQYSGPLFIGLSSTKSGHIVGITAEDKSIRVLKHDAGTSKLQQLSCRTMPKRPCAITLSYDDSTIICADKFGDVYSLPLLIPQIVTDDGRSILIQNPSPSSPLGAMSFAPAANELTVHSARNRKALQNQLRQIPKAIEKPEEHPEQKLLLGHVSMLTDIALVELDGRNYIVTADRDEHIRISRGIPQTHIIEGYCLGHTEFVSCLCAPATYPDLLISGGGEDEIYVWEWLAGKIIQKVNLRCQILELIEKTSRDSDATEITKVPGLPTNIVVSNIRHMKKGPSMQSDHIIITCEGIPALLIYSLLPNSTLLHFQTLPLAGNPLDVLIDYSHTKLILSLDTIHEPGSTSKHRKNIDSNAQRLMVLEMKDGYKWSSSSLQFMTPCPEEKCSGNEFPHRHDFSALFYGLENLRKRGGEE